MTKKTVIFDLDGVIVTTDKHHTEAWKRMAEEEGIYFDRSISERLRGVSRMECLKIILENSSKEYSIEKKDELATRKNEYYKELLKDITQEDILPGVLHVLNELKNRGIKLAIGSSSKNAPFILKKIGLESLFNAVADGNEIENSKPHPEVFLLAASKLRTKPEDCVVVEDAEAGIEAALAGGMRAVGVGYASNCSRAHYGAENMQSISIDELLK